MVVIVLMSKGFKRHCGLVGVCANNFVNLPVFYLLICFRQLGPYTVQYNNDRLTAFDPGQPG